VEWGVLCWKCVWGFFMWFLFFGFVGWEGGSWGVCAIGRVLTMVGSYWLCVG